MPRFVFRCTENLRGVILHLFSVIDKITLKQSKFTPPSSVKKYYSKFTPQGVTLHSFKDLYTLIRGVIFSSFIITPKRGVKLHPSELCNTPVPVRNAVVSRMKCKRVERMRWVPDKNKLLLRVDVRFWNLLR